jgi:hypothetical protein
MTIAYSTNLGLINITTGTESGLWGNYTNTNICSLLEQAVSGYGTQVMASAADTTVNITNGATSTGRNMYIKCTSSMAQANNLIVPTVSKLYFIENATTGGFNITVKTSGGTGIAVGPGLKMALLCDGTNVIEAINNINFTSLSVTSLTASGAVSAATVVSTGTTTASALVPSGAAVPTNGIYLPSANSIGFATNSTTRGNISSTGSWTIAAPTASVHTINLLAGTNGIEFKAGSCTYNIYIDGSNNAYTGTSTANQLNMLIGGAIAATWASGGGLDIKAPSTTTLPGLKVSGAAFTPSTVVTFNATTMTVNCALSNIFTTTFTANVTVAPTLSNPSDGQTLNWFITQDATGSRTMTWPTSFKWPGGTAGVLSTAANAVDLVVATYRSGTGFWYATISKAFA